MNYPIISFDALLAAPKKDTGRKYPREVQLLNQWLADGLIIYVQIPAESVEALIDKSPDPKARKANLRVKTPDQILALLNMARERKSWPLAKQSLTAHPKGAPPRFHCHIYNGKQYVDGYTVAQFDGIVPAEAQVAA